jgi:hypothetical protein
VEQVDWVHLLDKVEMAEKELMVVAAEAEALDLQGLVVVVVTAVMEL